MYCFDSVLCVVTLFWTTAFKRVDHGSSRSKQSEKITTLHNGSIHTYTKAYKRHNTDVITVSITVYNKLAEYNKCITFSFY